MPGENQSISDMERRALDFIAQPHPAEWDGLVRDMHALHFRANAPYRAYCESLGISEVVKNWREIPCVPQEAFKHSDLRSFPAEETVKTFRTSGTTGESYGQHHFRTLEIYETAVREGWLLAGAPAAPFLVIAPHPDEAPHSSLSHMLGVLAPRENFITVGAKMDLARLCEANAHVCLLGTALGFLRLFEEMGDNRTQLPPGSTAMETGGYKGSGRDIAKPDLYEMFADKLGIDPENVFNEYGMTELSSQFYARGPRGLHHGPPWARAVIADPVTLEEVADGETGSVLIYDAANVGSVVGIRTQDLAIKRGDAFELLGRDPAALPRGCSRAADELFSR